MGDLEFRKKKKGAIAISKAMKISIGVISLVVIVGLITAASSQSESVFSTLEDQVMDIISFGGLFGDSSESSDSSGTSEDKKVGRIRSVRLCFADSFYGYSGTVDLQVTVENIGEEENNYFSATTNIADFDHTSWNNEVSISPGETYSFEENGRWCNSMPDDLVVSIDTVSTDGFINQIEDEWRIDMNEVYSRAGIDSCNGHFEKWIVVTGEDGGTIGSGANCD